MTTFPNDGHGISRSVFSSESLYRWLLLKRKSRFGEIETEPAPPPQPEMEETVEPEGTEEPDADSIDDGTENVTDDPVDGGTPEENLTDPVVSDEPQPPMTAETEISDEADVSEVPEPDSLDDGTGRDTGDLVDGGTPDEHLADPVVAE
jgi:hypothetical protein